MKDDAELRRDHFKGALFGFLTLVLLVGFAITSTAYVFESGTIKYPGSNAPIGEFVWLFVKALSPTFAAIILPIAALGSKSFLANLKEPFNFKSWTAWVFILFVVAGAVAVSLVPTQKIVNAWHTVWGVRQPPAPIILPEFVSEWVGGGHSQTEMCAPLLAEYKTNYPNYVVRTTSTDEETHKTLFGQVQHRYLCRFVADPK